MVAQTAQGQQDSGESRHHDPVGFQFGPDLGPR